MKVSRIGTRAQQEGESDWNGTKHDGELDWNKSS